MQRDLMIHDKSCNDPLDLKQKDERKFERADRTGDGSNLMSVRLLFLSMIVNRR